MTESSSAPSSSFWNCLGTRMVVLASSTDPQDSKEGLLAVYRQQAADANSNSTMTMIMTATTADNNDDNDSTILLIRVGTSTKAYTGSIALAEVKLPLSDKQQLAQYMLQDGREHPNVTILFRYENTKNDSEQQHSSRRSSLKLIIQQKLVSSGLMKNSFSKVLSSSMSAMEFYQSLGQTINESQGQKQALQQQVSSTQKSVQNWKDTAEQLDKQVWQREKDVLVDNFLKLWNQSRASAKQEIQELRDELASAKTNAGTSKRAARALQLEIDAPDDLAAHQEPIPLEEVAALAEGRKTQSTRTPILDPSQALSMSKLKKQAEEYSQNKKKHKVSKTKTTVKMEEDESLRPKKRTKAQPKKGDDSLENDDTAEEQVVLQEDSEDEAMRRTIRESVRKSVAANDDSDASF